MSSARNPFPGLRPFRETEGTLFFGRAVEIEEMLFRLENSRFLTVVGASGSGKSSLVKAGLLPALERGFLDEIQNWWRPVIAQPGGAPIANLARAICGDDAGVEEVVDTEWELEQSPRGLQRELAKRCGGRPVLVLIDQFEELFRFRHELVSEVAERNEAVAYVNLLLAASRQTDLPVYVVLTMRSDFIGDCDAIYGLPEAINESQFLTPRMKRDQIRETIVGPLEWFKTNHRPGLNWEDDLVEKVVNDVGEDTDQLPLMQHALMRTWQIWAEQSGEGPVRLKHYGEDGAGTIKKALDRHAELVLEQVEGLEGGKDANLLLTRRIFQALTETDVEGRQIRRAIRLDDLLRVTERSKRQVQAILDIFDNEKKGQTFLVRRGEGKNEVVDICHESLIRQWVRLREWVAEEARWAGIYKRLTGAAKRRLEKRILHTIPSLRSSEDEPGNRLDDGEPQDEIKIADSLEGVSRQWLEIRASLEQKSGWNRLSMIGSEWAGYKALHTGTDLEEAVAWKKARNPNQAWAARYGGHFESALHFLRSSMRAHQMRQGAVVGVVVILFGLLAGIGFFQERALKAERASKRAAVVQALQARMETEWVRGDPLHSWLYLMAALDLAVEDDAVLPGTLGQLARVNSVWPEVVKFSESSTEAVALSPDGGRLAVGYGSEILIWEVEDGSVVPIRQMHREAVRSLAFSPDGQWLASGDEDGKVLLRNLGEKDARPIFLDPSKGNVLAVAFSADGRWLAAGTAARSGECMVVWDLDRSDYSLVPRVEPAVELDPGIGDVIDLSFRSGSGEPRLVGARYNGWVRSWNWLEGSKRPEEIVRKENDDESSGSEIVKLSSSGEWEVRLLPESAGLQVLKLGDERPWFPKGEFEGIAAVCADEDASVIAAGSENGTIWVWVREPSGNWIDPPKALESESAVTHLDIDDRGTRIAATKKGGTVTIWKRVGEDWSRWKIGGRVKEPLAAAESDLPAALPDEGPLVGAWFSRSSAGTAVIDLKGATLSVWKEGSWEDEAIGESSIGKVNSCVAMSPNGRWLAAGLGSDRVKVWEVDKLGEEPVMEPIVLGAGGDGDFGDVSGIVFAGNETLVAGDLNGGLRVWSFGDDGPATGDAPAAEFLPGGDAILSVGYEQKHDAIISGFRSGAVQVRFRQKINAPRRLRPQTQAVSCIEVSDDGMLLLTGSWDGTVMVRSMTPLSESRQVLEGPEEVLAVAISPKSKWIAAGGGSGTIYLWKASEKNGEWRRVADLSEKARSSGPVHGLSFSEDGSWLASGGEDGVRRWDLRLLQGFLRDGRANENFRDKYRQCFDHLGFERDGIDLIRKPPPLRLWDSEGGR